jgi:hypothetical protein
LNIKGIEDTVGNLKWVQDNEEDIKKTLPQTWTHAANIQMMKFGYDLKLIGVEWTAIEQLPAMMLWFEHIGILLRNGAHCRANPAKFNASQFK